MGDPEQDRPTVDALAGEILASYDADPRTRHIDAGVFPDKARAIMLLGSIRDLMFPGYFSEGVLNAGNTADHTARLVAEVRASLESLVCQALAYRARLGPDDPMAPAEPVDAGIESRAVADRFLAAVPEIRHVLGADVQAAFDGDPAARNVDETVFTYPGILAIMGYRVAHTLYGMGVPLLPRLLTEHVHHETGIDIHPGATIGASFFIDHGTGVVIGQTTVIGDRVKLYQGVTLGAMSFPKDAEGRLIRNTKRHPTIEDDVTVYANATILGGNTVVGAGSIIGGSVFLTKSVPPGHYVTLKSQDLRYRSAEVHDRIVTQQDDPEAKA